MQTLNFYTRKESSSVNRPFSSIFGSMTIHFPSFPKGGFQLKPSYFVSHGHKNMGLGQGVGAPPPPNILSTQRIKELLITTYKSVNSS